MRKQRGFTLVELLVVIAIIGILAGIVLASMSGARSKGRDAKRVADIKQLQLALQLYYDGNGKYPSGNGSVSSTLSTLTSGNYLSVLPTDPLSTSGYSYGYKAYPLACTTTCNDYVLGAQLENTTSTLDGYKGTGVTVTVNGDANKSCSTTLNLYCVKP